MFLQKKLIKLIIFLIALNTSNLIYSKFINKQDATELAKELIQTKIASIDDNTKDKIINDILLYSYFEQVDDQENYDDNVIKAYLKNLVELIKYSKEYFERYAYKLKDFNKLYFAASKALLHLILIEELKDIEFDQEADFSRIQSALIQGYNKKEDSYDLEKIFNDINNRFNNPLTTYVLLIKIKDKRLEINKQSTEIANIIKSLFALIMQETTISNAKQEIQKFIKELAKAIKLAISISSSRPSAMNFVITLQTLLNDKYPLFKHIPNIKDIFKELQQYIAEFKTDKDSKKFDENIEKLVNKIEVKKEVTRQTLNLFVHALLGKNLKNADELIKNFGSNLINANIDGHTPLTLLLSNVQESPVEAVSYLITNNADVNQPNKEGITPLMYAVWRGFVNTAKLLIDSGAKKDAKANNGATPLTIAKGQPPMPTLKPENSNALVSLLN